MSASTGPINLQVDLDGLRDLQGVVEQLHGELNALTNDGVDETIMGDPSAGRALSNFVNNWRDGRAKIVAELENASRLLACAYQTYEHVEAELSKVGGAQG